MLLKREPVLFATLVRASIVLATAFGLKLDAAQIGAIMLFTEAVLGFLVRSAVTTASSMGRSDSSVAPPGGPTPAIAG